jgi:hypothetical protein
MPCSRQDFDHLPRRMAYHGAADHHHSRCNCVPLLPQHRNDLDRGTRISRCSSLNRLIGAPIQSLGRELIAVGDDNGWKRVLPPAPRNAVTFTGGGGAVGRIWQTKSNDRQDQTSEDDGVNRGRTVDVNVNVNVLLKTGFRRMVERLRFLTLGCCLLRAEGERPPDSATPQPEDCSRFVSIFPLPCLLPTNSTLATSHAAGLGHSAGFQLLIHLSTGSLVEVRSLSAVLLSMPSPCLVGLRYTMQTQRLGKENEDC